ncbi:MAG: hypothetical protein ACI8X5_001851 [Planctomycetota bacterium]|jgi:hypothetical protein
MRLRSFSSFGLVLLLSSFQAVRLPGQAVLNPSPVIRAVASTTTQMPGQSYNFTDFHSACIDGGRVAFNGGNFLFADGIYYHAGVQLSRVVDTTMQVPSLTSPVPFVGLSTASLAGTRVAFLGASNSGAIDYEGIWIWQSGSMQVVVEKGDPSPNVSGGIFFFLFPPSLGRTEVVWNGYVAAPGQDVRGIHSSAGGVHTLVDTSDSIPGTGTSFGDFSFNPTVDSRLAFLGGVQPGDFDGVFVFDSALPIGQQLAVVADLTSTVPGTGLTFTAFFDGATARNGEVAFRGRSGSLIGVYSTLNGLHTVADTNTIIPGRSQPFTGFNQFSQHGPALDRNGDVAFVGEGAGGLRGIYAERGGVLRAVVETGDIVNGHVVSTVDLGREGLDGGSVVFVLRFADTSSGVFVQKL